MENLCQYYNTSKNSCIMSTGFVICTAFLSKSDYKSYMICRDSFPNPQVIITFFGSVGGGLGLHLGYSQWLISIKPTVKLISWYLKNSPDWHMWSIMRTDRNWIVVTVSLVYSLSVAVVLSLWNQFFSLFLHIY